MAIKDGEGETIAFQSAYQVYVKSMHAKATALQPVEKDGDTTLQWQACDNLVSLEHHDEARRRE